MFFLTDQAIDRELSISALREPESGALTVFEGWVRDHNQGKKVASLDYQVYPELARKEGEKILDEARKKFNLRRVACTHRFGHLEVGDIAVWVGAVAAHRDDAFKAARYVIDEIKHRLPIWKKEHYLDVPAEWVSCLHHHTHVHFREEDYYRKQARLVDQAALKRAKVSVVGAGGLGCPVLSLLAAAGVGDIKIVDFDRVDISNIHRQPLFAPSSVGEKKAVLAQKKLSELNPFIEVGAFDLRVHARNVEELIQGRDLVVDCTDSMETKFLLHDACFKARIPLVSASIFQYVGQVRTFDPERGTGCLRCTYQDQPDDGLLGNCNDFGVLGASVSTIGAIQAKEVIEFLQTRTNATTRETFYFDLRDLSQMKIRNTRKENCPTCAGLVDLQESDLELRAEELANDCELVDIRDQEDSFLDRFRGHDKKVVVYCHRGGRSKRLVRRYRAEGCAQFYSLSGGACSL